ncbi:MAG: fasciclin domain-containing protein, partial [Bacteroidaceae bacterium]|nr:fasciclin domain-containing protein [Bacteroidaceae bacterium]
MNKSMVKRILYILAVLLSIVACSDEIDKSNRYTFTGETVADYLLNRSDRYSHFISLLKRAELLSLLQTYGQYTLFLPDDAAIEKYVQEQDSIYQEYKDTDTPIWTGITSPLVDEVSDSMARVITRTHLLEGRYMTAQFGEGALTKWNMNDRYLGVNYRGSDEGFYIVINNNAVVVGSDNEVENGVVHMVDRVIDSSVEEVPVMIAKQPFFSIFAEALDATGFADSLFRTMDLEYSPKNYSTSETYPPFRFYKYTGFIEPDEVFHKNGIYTLADLKAFAEKWYGTEDSDSLQSPRNALYRFVAYHFLDRELPYDKLVITKYYDDNYYYPRFDLYDYFEMANGRMMKITKPLSTVDGGSIFLNYSKRDVPYNFEMRKHLNVRILETTEFTQSNEKYANFRQYASNGIIHPIDKILVYNEEEMAGNILNERMRIDIVSLLPELSCNNIRFADITMQYI